MKESDLTTQLNILKNVQPNSDWAVLARKNLLNHIEQEATAKHSEAVGRFGHWPLGFDWKLEIGNWKFAKAGAGAFAFSVVALMVFSTVAAQRSLPGSPFYNVKLALEGAQSTVTPGSERKLELKTAFTERRVEEVSQLASHKLDAARVAVLSEKLNTYRSDLAHSKEASNAGDFNKKVAVIEEQARVLTAVINESDESASLEDNLRTRIMERVEGCESEGLAASIGELLEAGDVASLIDAHELSLGCTST